jgi:hypothetical protein
MPHQLPFRAYPFKKHDELQFEEHDRINRQSLSCSKTGNEECSAPFSRFIVLQGKQRAPSIVCSLLSREGLATSPVIA